MANRFLVAGGDGLWNSTSNWASVSGGGSGASFPVAGDVVAFDSLSGNAPMTVNVASACASFIMSGTYAGTLTFNSTLTLTSTCTFLSTCTIAGTAGTLIGGGGATYTSGGKTLTCALTLTASAAYTLADNWVVNGLVTAGTGAGTPTIVGVGKTLTCVGGFHQAGTTGTVGGTAKLVIAGGTWDSASTGGLIMDVDLAGTVTVSGAVFFGGVAKTLRYVSGTITTTGSTLGNTATSQTPTFDTAGVTWGGVTLTGTSAVYTLNSAFAWNGTLTLGPSSTVTGTGAMSGTGAVAFSAAGTLTLNNAGGLVTTGTMTLGNFAYTFAGSAGFTAGTLTTATLTSSRTHTLTFGNTYAVTTSLANAGTTAAIRQAMVSSSPGSKVVLTLSGTSDLQYCDPTDIDSSAGRQVVTLRGTVTTSLNWTTTSPAGGGGGAQNLFIGGVS